MHETLEHKSFWDKSLTGEPVFDINFDLSPVANQNIMRDFCLDMATSDWAYSKKPYISCPMLDFQQWLKDGNEDFPVAPANFISKVHEFIQDTGN